jgi:hypothetical protein
MKPLVIISHPFHPEAIRKFLRPRARVRVVARGKLAGALRTADAAIVLLNHPVTAPTEKILGLFCFNNSADILPSEKLLHPDPITP